MFPWPCLFWKGSLDCLSRKEREVRSREYVQSSRDDSCTGRMFFRRGGRTPHQQGTTLKRAITWLTGQAAGHLADQIDTRHSVANVLLSPQPPERWNIIHHIYGVRVSHHSEYPILQSLPLFRNAQFNPTVNNQNSNLHRS